MDRNTRGLLVGMSLGDGYIQVRERSRDGNGPYVSASMQVKHSVSQVDYCEYKASLLRAATGRKCEVRFYDAMANGKTYKQAQFSFSHPYVRTLHGWMYKDGKKFYDKQTMTYLTPEGIAIWYMDDGTGRVNRNKDGVITSCSTSIATMCSREEVDTIVDFFQGEYGIEFKKRYDKRRPESKAWFIEANTEASRKFDSLVQPYIIKSMEYKLAHIAGLGSHECGTTSRSAKAIWESKI